MSTARIRVVALALPALASVAACAQTENPAMTAAEASARQCFRPDAVSGFRPEGRDTVYFTVAASQVYRAEIVGVCPDIDSAQGIAIRTTSPGAWVCHGLDAELIVPSPTGAQRCPLTDIRRLSDTELQAYRERRH